MPWVFFFAVDLLLLSFFLLGSFFFSGFSFSGVCTSFFLRVLSSFSRFVLFFFLLFEIECKKLKIHIFFCLKSSVKNSRFMFF